MKILVTGGAGFIGSNVVDAYIQAGHEVAVVDDLSEGNVDNINPRAKFYEIDIANPKLEEVFAEFKPELVNHHAAQISVPLSVDQPLNDARINVIGLINLLECCRKHQVQKVIYVSSGGVVYGEPEELPATETMPLEPASPYGISKYTGELYLKFFAKQCGLTYVVFRYSNVYGPRQVPHGEAGVVSIFIKALLAGKTPVIYGDGTCIRDYVFVGDIVDANLRAVEKGKNIALNIGTNKPTDVNELYAVIKKVTETDINADHGPARRGDLKANYLNAELAQKTMGWKPRTTLEEGINQTFLYFKALQEGGQG